MTSVREHRDLTACLAAVVPARVFALTTRATRSVYDAEFRAGDAFVFGPETSGLPQGILDTFAPEMRLRIPMRAGNRSLNLSNAAAVTVYEAWRQLGFAGSTTPARS
jgi:tRNA (cytidine/uridine-2'-O-)-methyltransferase